MYLLTCHSLCTHLSLTMCSPVTHYVLTCHSRGPSADVVQFAANANANFETSVQPPVDKPPAEVSYFLHNAVGSSSSDGGMGTADLYGDEGIAAVTRGPTMYIQSDSVSVSTLRLISRQGLSPVDTNTKYGAIVEVLLFA